MINLTDELKIAIEVAMENAAHRRHEFAGTEHLFLALLHDPVSQKALKKCGANVRALREATEVFLEEELEEIPDGFPVDVSPSVGFQEALQRAAMNAQASERNEIAGPHVLIALFNLRDCFSTYLLKEQGVSALDLKQYVSHRGEEGDALVKRPDREYADGHGDEEYEEYDDDEDDEEGKTPLEKYCVNLNEEAAAGRIDPMVGRDKELQRTIHILCRRRKNNPVFVGDAGVGKTAIVEGLALAITEERVPEVLGGAVIYALDMGSLVAGTRYRGDFEERLKGVVWQLERMPEAVLFVDEIHTVIGAGAVSGGALDAASILKPQLARGKIRCIGATTWKEYRNVFERDHAMARRFQKIEVNEPTIPETVEILRGLKRHYEEFHGVSYTEDALDEAAKLSAKYLHDRFLPDKAIDVIDEAGADVKLRGADAVYVEDIEGTLARMARIPEKKVGESEQDRLKRLEADLKSVVFGQDEAITHLATAVKVARSGLANPKKPVGAFLFTGPTGVGKTEVAVQLADILGLELIRFDMSEYMERHSVSRLIGAPPGYVGFDQGGLLTEQVSKNPHSVVLLDEIEKAHPEVFNILLQVMDNGSLTDNNGRKADFRNVILIMTSNVGARDLARTRPGFATQEGPRTGSDEEAFKRTFSPEFRNRLDARIRFGALPQEVVELVVEKFVRQLSAQLGERGVRIELTDPAKKRLAILGYDPENGARPLDRVIRDKVKRPLADDLLFGALANGGKVIVDIHETDEEAFAFHFPKAELEAPVEDEPVEPAPESSDDARESADTEEAEGTASDASEDAEAPDATDEVAPEDR
jgi:ATP-dependent Clp protease ATP-binding subunit ClpA